MNQNICSCFFTFMEISSIYQTSPVYVNTLGVLSLSCNHPQFYLAQVLRRTPNPLIFFRPSVYQCSDLVWEILEGNLNDFSLGFSALSRLFQSPCYYNVNLYLLIRSHDRFNLQQVNNSCLSQTVVQPLESFCTPDALHIVKVNIISVQNRVTVMCCPAVSNERQKVI